MDENVEQWIPFADAPWNAAQRKGFDGILAWDQQMKNLPVADLSGEVLKARLADEAAQLRDTGACSLVSDALCQSVFGEAAALNLPPARFIQQLEHAYYHYGALSFEDNAALKQYMQAIVIPRGTLVAGLADLAHNWQVPQVGNLSTAFSLVGKLLNLERDLSADRVFIPRADLAQAGVSVEELKQGVNDARTQKLLWKQIIRIRDAFAQGQPLVKEVPRKFRRTFKKNWLTGLELVGEIERRGYDLWSSPVSLSAMQRFQVNVLAFIGKGVSHARGR